MDINNTFLQSQALFGGISDQGIERIRPLLNKVVFAPGDFAIREKERGHELYIIAEGSAEILKEVHSDGQTTLKKLTDMGPGDVFGEMEILDILPRSASVRAVTELTTLSLSNKHLYDLYHRDLEVFTMIVMNLARELSRRLRAMDEKVQ